MLLLDTNVLSELMCPKPEAAVLQWLAAQTDALYALAPTAYRAPAGLLAAVAYDWRQTGEIGNSCIGKRADHGHLGDETGDGVIGDNCSEWPRNVSWLVPASIGSRCCSTSATARYGMNADRQACSWFSGGVDRECEGQLMPLAR